MARHHPLTRLMLLDPGRVERRLEAFAARGILERVPNSWQVTLGAMRMWHRMLFRPESIGNCDNPVRDSWRARLLHNRALRIPALFHARAIAPWDLSGLFSSHERVGRHLLAAHHEQNQFAYDLEMLADDPGSLERIREAAQAVIDGSHPRANWLRDLAVFEGYHEDLVAALDDALAGELRLSPAEQKDPDISFLAFMRWCATQPATPGATRRAWMEGRYTWADGLRRPSPAAAAERFASLDRAGLTRALREGHRVDPAILDDSEWRGVSLGLPELADKLAWKTFVKVFARAPSGQLRGWNLRLEQDGLDAPPRPRTRRNGELFTFGHFEVVPAHGRRPLIVDEEHLLLDYGRGGNPRLDPIGRLRDPIVAPDPKNPDLLLGWSYLELGQRRVSTPSFFTLERLGPRTHDAKPPRAA